MRADRLLTTHDVGRMLQMDPSSIVKWVNDGLLPAYKTPGGHRRIRTTDLLAFLREHKMYVPPELATGVRRVLIVDDDAKVLKALERGLKGTEGLEVETCGSGIEALVRIGARRPHVLVLDINMPELDGFQVLERLKANPATASIEVVVVTGDATAAIDKKAKGLGAKEVMEKPLSATALNRVLNGESIPSRAARG